MMRVRLKRPALYQFLACVMLAAVILLGPVDPAGAEEPGGLTFTGVPIPLCDPRTHPCCLCPCITGKITDAARDIDDTHKKTKKFFGSAKDIPSDPGKNSGTGEMGKYQNWVIDELFKENLAPMMMDMARQFSTIIMHQALVFGAFTDAAQQLETQRTFQRLTAQAHKDYHPSTGLCSFGTLARSLSAAESNTRRTAHMLNERAVDRALDNVNSVAAQKQADDRDTRLAQFAARYCNRKDNYALEGKPFTGLALLCKATVAPGRSNRDIDYRTALLQPRTLDLGFDGEAHEDDADIAALAVNLYQHTPYDKRITDALISEPAAANVYLDLRAVAAKRNVAQTAFNQIAALKAQGTPESEQASAPYQKAIFSELGITDSDELAVFLGKRPSYFAQMEVLAKKIYQRPGFYVDLYDKPENVKRRSVAMRAVGLMLNRDIYESYLRSEAIMSVLLETKIMQAQTRVEDERGGQQ